MDRTKNLTGTKPPVGAHEIKWRWGLAGRYLGGQAITTRAKVLGPGWRSWSILQVGSVRVKTFSSRVSKAVLGKIYLETIEGSIPSFERLIHFGECFW